MSHYLWKADALRVENASLTKFIAYINSSYNTSLHDYNGLHQWSINNLGLFWVSLWDFTAITGDKGAAPYLKIKDTMLSAQWFSDGFVNYAENLLKKRPSMSPVITQISTTGETKSINYSILYQEVASLSCFLKKEIGLNKGDHVSAIVPNTINAISAMLSTTAIGAVWSACAPDFGYKALYARLEQIKPKVLFMTSSYFDGHQSVSLIDKVARLINALPDIETVILIDDSLIFDERFNHVRVTAWHSWEQSKDDISFEKMSFSDPLYVLFSSGTTGAPKCIVHGHGGTLLQHVKELHLHCNLQAGEKLFFYTSTGWMMWNWMVSALAINVNIVVYDGSPLFPHLDKLFEIADSLGVHVLGINPQCITALIQAGISINKKFKLEQLKTVLSTGSVLPESHYEYFYQHIKNNALLASISGGTDIISCFMLGCDLLPVFSGELQCAGLGMDIDVFDESGNTKTSGPGQLVCKSPFPSMPLCFLNDPNNTKYIGAYFLRFTNVWCHGDYVEKTKNSSFILRGRSDAVLNIGGIRMGTSELYKIVNEFHQIQDSLAIQFTRDNKDLLLIFVQMQKDKAFSNTLSREIKRAIKTEISVHYVPHKIYPVSDLPRTYNGKLAELAIKKYFLNAEIDNTDSLSNLECMEDFIEIRRNLYL